MEGRTVGVVEPIARVEGQQLNLGTFGQRGRLIQHQPAGVNTSLDRHTEERNTRPATSQAQHGHVPRCGGPAGRALRTEPRQKKRAQDGTGDAADHCALEPRVALIGMKVLVDVIANEGAAEET